MVRQGRHDGVRSGHHVQRGVERLENEFPAADDQAARRVHRDEQGSDRLRPDGVEQLDQAGRRVGRELGGRVELQQADEVRPGRLRPAQVEGGAPAELEAPREGPGAVAPGAVETVDQRVQQRDRRLEPELVELPLRLRQGGVARRLRRRREAGQGDRRYHDAGRETSVHGATPYRST